MIFDSLAGASRSRVVATLRDYLSCEHVAKLGVEKTFSKDTIKGACPKVPQQSNFTDCGLYVLQYVESFFKASILKYLYFFIIIFIVYMSNYVNYQCDYEFISFLGSC